MVFLSTVAWAKQPMPDLLPTIEPVGFERKYSQEAETRGATGQETEAACRGFAEGLLLCFTVADETERTYVTTAHLAQWEVTAAGPGSVDR